MFLSTKYSQTNMWVHINNVLTSKYTQTNMWVYNYNVPLLKSKLNQICEYTIIIFPYLMIYITNEVSHWRMLPRVVYFFVLWYRVLKKASIGIISFHYIIHVFILVLLCSRTAWDVWLPRRSAERPYWNNLWEVDSSGCGN